MKEGEKRWEKWKIVHSIGEWRGWESLKTSHSIHFIGTVFVCLWDVWYFLSWLTIEKQLRIESSVTQITQQSHCLSVIVESRQFNEESWWRLSLGRWISFHANFLYISQKLKRSLVTDSPSPPSSSLSFASFIVVCPPSREGTLWVISKSRNHTDRNYRNPPSRFLSWRLVSLIT